LLHNEWRCRHHPTLCGWFVYTGLRIGGAAWQAARPRRNDCNRCREDRNAGDDSGTAPGGNPQGGSNRRFGIHRPRPGAPLLKNSLGNAFRVACSAACVDKSAHGIRKAAATHAADQGATGHELEAIFGRTSGQMAAHYTRKANHKALAKGAMAKLDQTKSRTSMLPPENAAGASGRKNKSIKSLKRKREGLRSPPVPWTGLLREIPTPPRATTKPVCSHPVIGSKAPWRESLRGNGVRGHYLLSADCQPHR
jgi:hypothetical protein